MSAQHHFAPGDQWDRDLYANERILNSAIIAADISKGWEENLEVLDIFYADDVEVTADKETGPIRGKERTRALLLNFLAPLYVMVEIGGPAIHVRKSNLIGVSGRTCTLNWCTLRRWADSRVVYERHYDYQQSGGPVTGGDLSLNQSLPTLGYGRPS